MSQTEDYIVMKNWINQHNVKFNSPETPKGYTKYWDCDSCIAFKRVNGDTIIFLTSRSYGAVSFSEFCEEFKLENYNKSFYPKWYQSNATIIIAHFEEKVFIFRNDSLYLRDENKDYMVEHLIKNMELKMSGKIDSLTFEKNMAEAKRIETIKHPPKFKLIFYKGIFDEKSKVTFSKNENFRKETVELIKKWDLNGKTCYRILLHTNTAGDYVFTSDMTFLDMEVV